MRLFVAVVPPHKVLDDLARVVTPLRDKALTWALTDAWHVTLAFYGEVSDDLRADLSRRLARAAHRYEPFSLQVRGAGRFGRSVLWAGVAGDVEPLRRLAMSAMASGRRAGLDVEAGRRFRPHITLARSSRNADLRPYVEQLRDYEGEPWTVHDIALIRSHLGAGPGRRPRYETLDTYPLR